MTNSDLFKATSFSAAIFGFNTKCDSKTRQLAEHEKIHISTHDVIYSLVDDVRELLIDQLPLVPTERMLGSAEVLEVITLNGSGRSTFSVAGCKVTSGTIRRSCNGGLRLMRKGELLYKTPQAASMRHFKQKVSEAKQGSEFAIQLAESDDVVTYEKGDIIHAVEITQERATL